MNVSEDIARIKEQERVLVLQWFDEQVAFEIGSIIREKGMAAGLPIVVDISTWDRRLFYAALANSTADNANWARRKHNVVRNFLKSTYRLVLEQQRPDRTFKPGAGLDIADFVLAGGGFPITVRGAGVIGAIAVSGLPEREDHGIVVEGLARHLGVDADSLALPASA
jgi:uncharacterized protein (UPF0303 family)